MTRILWTENEISICPFTTNEPIRCCTQQDVGRIHFVFFGLGNKYLEEVKNKCILEFSLAKWGEMPSNSRTWRRLSYFKILRIHLVGEKKGRKGKKKKERAKRRGCCCGFPLELRQYRTAEDTDKTAQEPPRLISLAHSLLT